MRDIRIKFGLWLERLTTVAVMMVAAASVYWAFWAPPSYRLRFISFPVIREVSNRLRLESDPGEREALLGRAPIEVGSWHYDAMMPTNARVFFLGVLGPENYKNSAVYCTLAHYLFPREVAISLGEPPILHSDRFAGRSPSSVAELQQAGYDFLIRLDPVRTVAMEELGSSHLLPRDTKLKPIPGGDWMIALWLPLAVAITGSRVVRWLFRDLNGILSTGELLAGGLAVGAFLLTQLTLGLRLAGARWERALTAIVMVWAAGEVIMLARRWRPPRPQLKARSLWWLLLVPAGLILWCQFRLAGLLGLLDYDGVMMWAFKAKILHYYSGRQLWTCFHNPALAYARLDYPLLVPLLHALTYGALGHVNEFVTKFWNQWMLLLLVWAVLELGRFLGRRPWLPATIASVLVLLPMSRNYALVEGPTIPMVFYVVSSSVQLAIGMVEKQAGRLRLGLLLLMATAMVRSEGILLLALWAALLLLDRESRVAVWPPLRVGWAGWLGLAAWAPFNILRLNQHVPTPEAVWAGQLLTHTSTVLGILPVTWVAMLSCRFLNNDFAAWGSPDNQHVLWAGHWTGWSSLVDAWMPGVGWVCLLLLVVAWFRDGRLRGTAIRLCLVFLMFATTISVVWSAAMSSPMNYDYALIGSKSAIGVRYLYPVLMAWFVAGVVLLMGKMPGDFSDSGAPECTGNTEPPASEHTA